MGLYLTGLAKEGYLTIKTVDATTASIIVDVDGKGAGAGVTLAGVHGDLNALKDAGAIDFGTPVKPVPPPVDPVVINVVGTSGNDNLLGTAAGETISGGKGNDKINGGAGDDHLWGNNGNDILNGGAGHDWLKGGDGKDTFAFTNLSDGGDTIADFRTAEKIDISSIVDTFNTNGVNMTYDQLLHDGFIKLEKAGGDLTKVFIDIDGTVGAETSGLLADVHGVSLNKDSFIL